MCCNMIIPFCLLSCALVFGQEKVVLGATSTNLKLLYDALAPAYKDVGLEAEWKEFPGSRLLAEVQAGTLDAMVAASGTMVKQFSDNYIGIGYGNDALGYSRLYMYVRAADKDKYKPDPKTWAGLSIGEIADVGPSPTFGFPKNVNGVKIVTAPTYESVLRMLDSGRTDFVVSTRGGVEKLIQDLGLKDRIVRIDTPLLTVDYWHLVNKKYMDKIPALKQAIERHRQQIDEAVDKLVNR